MLNSQIKRTSCPRCLRPESACLCRWIVPLPNVVEVLILQHPLEVNNAKGSARLLDLCLQDSRMIAGEQFDESLLQATLYANDKQPVLLYPATSLNEAPDLQYQPVDLVLQEQLLSDLRLVIIDATWRKSRKMLYLNSRLQQLPRLSLQDMPASHYRIRKAHAPDQLSTLEATAYALMQLERDEGKYQPLLQAFDGFVGQQMGFRPA
ncbi:tRNA-uridine aminocarboxypropyltransferase [Undibacterium sp. TJN19]|uniref:tRNA-uridine aminocarboxypropyltransferase n=1 Tax=Undibacterium sp. TJN19 TaxID=3413055 RepID=UPI003BF2A814